MAQDQAAAKKSISSRKSFLSALRALTDISMNQQQPGLVTEL